MTTKRNDFEHWLFEMDEQISILMKLLPPEISEKLDYSASSLSVLEKWLLNSYPSVRSLLEKSEQDVLDRLSRYTGETIRRNLGGIWNIDLKNKKNVYFEVPVVEAPGIWVECPLSMVTAATERRKGDYMEGILKFLMEQHGKP